MTAYTIKPLEWKAIREFCHMASTIFGTLAVSCLSGQWYWALVKDMERPVWKLCDSIDDGKAKAEAYYRERLLPALVPVSPMEVIVDPVFPAEIEA